MSRTEIRTEYLPNASLESYLYANLLGRRIKTPKPREELENDVRNFQ
jgi:hypothetical protein